MTVGGPSVPASEDPLLNKVLSERYRILKRLGEGGMGVVYLAEHVVIEKKIALKVLFPDLIRRSDLVQRFMQEAKSASRINHENVIDITDFGQSPEGYVFIAMEYLVGSDLGQLLKASGPLPWQRAQPIALQITKALRAAHERGIVHRDMKPENVFVSPRDDGREFVKVLDFGIAKVLGLDEDAPRLTRTGMIFGTPEYMSPEQAQGQQVDHRVDIYAVGCLLYHMLTGEVPFKAESFMGILSKHMLEAPVPARQRNPTIEPEVEAVITRAMEKDPDRRFPTMRAFVEALVPLGHIPDKSGAISMATGLPSSPRPSRANPPATTLSHATKEVPGRVSAPLAETNPEARRSQTEIFSREDQAPPRRARSSNLMVLAVGAGAALALGLLWFFVARGRSPAPAAKPPTSAASVVVTDPRAPNQLRNPPPTPEVTVPKPAPPLAAPPAPSTNASPGANPNRGAANRRSRETGRPGRSSRAAVDSLFPASGESSNGNRAPADASGRSERVRTPNELKNPFAP